MESHTTFSRICQTRLEITQKTKRTEAHLSSQSRLLGKEILVENFGRHVILWNIGNHLVQNLLASLLVLDIGNERLLEKLFQRCESLRRGLTLQVARERDEK